MDIIAGRAESYPYPNRNLQTSEALPPGPSELTEMAGWGEEKDMEILNMTQHVATTDQKAQGVVEPEEQHKELIKKLLTFTELPKAREVKERAKKLAAIAANLGVKAAMIGGAPYLMGPLHNELEAVGIVPLYAYSERIVEEVVKEDGTTEKKSIFKHLGFVGAEMLEG